MTLARVWTRQLLGASGIALAVPLALVGSLAALALAGGFGGIGAFGQVFSGPSLLASLSTGATPSSRNAAQVARALAAISHPVLVASVPQVGAVSPGASRTTAATGTGGGTRSTGTTHHRGGTHGVGRGGHPRPHPTPPRVPTPPKPPPTVVDAVAGVVTSVTGQVPGPVGSTATSAVNSVAQGLDGILKR